MKNNKKPEKWEYVYPHGTKEGAEELKLFKVLTRNPKYDWRSVEAIVKETNLTAERVEEILAKYYKKGMVFQKPNNENLWGYWENVPESMLPKQQKSVSKRDKDDRIKKAVNKSYDIIETEEGSNKINEKLKSMIKTHTVNDSKVYSVFFDCDTKAENFVKKIKEQFRKKDLEALEKLKLQVLAENRHVGCGIKMYDNPIDNDELAKGWEVDM